MVNVLLNYYNFDGEWARPHLQRYVTGRKVLILPLAFRQFQAWDNDSWQSIYGKHGEKYDAITRPFLQYGYAERDLDWFNCFDCPDGLRQIQQADLLFFTGGMPEKALDRLDKLGLTDAVRGFDGVVMGASAGAMLQLDRYHITPDEDYADYGIWQGLGMVRGLDLEVHYLATSLQDECAQRARRQLGVPVYKMWHEGGLLVEDGKVTVLGNVQLLA